MSHAFMTHPLLYPVLLDASHRPPHVLTTLQRPIQLPSTRFGAGSSPCTMKTIYGPMYSSNASTIQAYPVKNPANFGPHVIVSESKSRGPTQCPMISSSSPSPAH